MMKSERDPEIKNSLKQDQLLYSKEVECMSTKLYTELKENGTQSITDLKGKGEERQVPQIVANNDELSKYITYSSHAKWENVDIFKGAKQYLIEALILPIKFPQLFNAYKYPVKGILLYGPPGNGKTYLANALAAQTGCTFISIHSQTILFDNPLDQVDKEIKNKAKAELLVQMQSPHKDVYVLISSSQPWDIDSLIRRRFEWRVYMSIPDQSARKFLLKFYLMQTQNTLKEEDYEIIAQKTEGFSFSDVQVLVKDATVQPIRKLKSVTKFKQLQNGKLMPVEDSAIGSDIIEQNFIELNPQQIIFEDITIDDFSVSLEMVKASISEKEIKQYEEWTKEFSQDL